MSIIVSVSKNPRELLGYSLLVKLSDEDSVKNEIEDFRPFKRIKNNHGDGIEDSGPAYEEDDDEDADRYEYDYNKYDKDYKIEDYKLNDKTLRRFNIGIRKYQSCYEEYGTLEESSDIYNDENLNTKNKIPGYKKFYQKHEESNGDDFHFQFVDPIYNIKSLEGLRILSITSINNKKFLKRFPSHFFREKDGGAEIIEFICCDVNDSTKIKKVMFTIYNMHNGYYHHNIQTLYYSNKQFRRSYDEI